LLKIADFTENHIEQAISITKVTYMELTVSRNIEGRELFRIYS
jgi:hypothetical protein